MYNGYTGQMTPRGSRPLGARVKAALEDDYDGLGRNPIPAGDLTEVIYSRGEANF